MSKIKLKKQLKKQKRQQRKNEFGFTRTKQIVEIEGSEEGYFLDSSPFLEKQHEQVEEVLIVNNDKKELLPEKPRFNQLSTLSVSQLVQFSQDQQDQGEDLGFFFDSTPATETVSKEQNKKKNKKKEHKEKIIQDDSVFIALTDDEDDEDDDHLSISSSEDIEIIKSLAHWSKQDDLNQLEIDSFKKRRRRSLDAMDYHLLESMCIGDIVEEKKEASDDDLLLTEDIDFEEELHNVPTSLIQSYKGLIREEKSRYNLEKRHLQKKKNNKEMVDSRTILEEIIREFIDQQDIESYHFKNLTSHGRNVIVPKIAKLFQLKTIELDTNFVKLEKTLNTCIPTSYKHYMNQKQLPPQQLKKKSTTRNKRTVSRKTDAMNHGKEVAVHSAPISSNNIGHRMLSAMGWKEGDTIGNNEDGIKEPIKVFMRANRRGLGA